MARTRGPTRKIRRKSATGKHLTAVVIHRTNQPAPAPLWSRTEKRVTKENARRRARLLTTKKTRRKTNRYYAHIPRRAAGNRSRLSPPACRDSLQRVIR